MALSFSNAAETYLESTSGLPAVTGPLTFVVFVKLPLPATGTDGGLFDVFDFDGHFTSVYMWHAPEEEFTGFGLEFWCDGDNYGFTNLFDHDLQDTWIAVAVTRNGANTTFRIREYGGSEWVTNESGSSAGVGPYSAEAMRYGNERMDRTGTFHASGCKIWDAVLSESEIEAECNSLAPIRTANLNRYTPLDGSTLADHLVDASGNGSDWTANNTPAVVPGPPGGSTAVDLEGVALASAAAAATLTRGVPISGAAIASSIANGQLTLHVNLSGSAFVSALAAAQMARGVPLAGSASAVADASGDLSVTADAALSGSAIASANAAAALHLSIALSGEAIAALSASAALSHGVPLGSDATAQAIAAGVLTLTTRLTGAAIASASGEGELTHQVALEGDAIARAQGSAALLGTADLAGSATAGAEAAGTLSLTIALTAQAVANALATGSLNVALRLSSNAVATALAGGDLTVLSDVQLQGHALARAQASAALNVGTGMTIAKMNFSRMRSRMAVASQPRARSIAFHPVRHQ